MIDTPAIAATHEPVWVRRIIIAVGVLFVGLFVLVPLIAVFGEALRNGIAAYGHAIADPVALAAVKLASDASGTSRDEEELPEVDLPQPDDRGGRRKAAGRDQRRGRPAKATTRLFVGTGRSSGVRPQDLVGVIARKSYLSGRDIGAIEISDRFSLVEVPEPAADDVVRALRGTSIKGQKATVRRERFPAR